MTALAYTAAIQSQIFQTLLGDTAANASANHKILIDGTWTSGAISGGVALSVFTRINQIAQYYQMAGLTTAPDVWDQWWIAETVWQAGLNIQPDRVPMFRQIADMAKQVALGSFSATGYDATAAPSADTAKLTLQSIRKYVASHCVRIADPPGPLYPQFDVIDELVNKTLIDLWKRPWTFRRRVVNITIASNSAVTTDLTGETIDQIATFKFYYTDSAGYGSELRWGNADAVAAVLARQNGVTGRPIIFRIQEGARATETGEPSKTWIFAPTPSESFTARGEVYVDGPGFPSSATDTTVFFKFPNEFGPIIKELVLANVLFHYKRIDSKAFKAKMDEQIQGALADYDDPGKPDSDQAPRDVYGDIGAITGWPAALGGAV